MRRLALALIALTLLAPAASARRRTAHHPANACSFSLAPTWGSAPVPATGLTQSLVLVYGQTQDCAQWAAYSSVAWINVEAAPLAAQPGAFVNISPNTSTTQRSGTLIIAGVRLVVTQEGASTLSPPIANNILVNGTFDRTVGSWTWFAGFPNGIGSAIWSDLDANGDPASGSMRLRDADFNRGQAFQQLQCVIMPVGGGSYEYGATINAARGGAALLALVTYKSTDCSGTYNRVVLPDIYPSEANVWQKVRYQQLVSSAVRSAAVVVGSAADDGPPFDVYFDDIFLREVK